MNLSFLSWHEGKYSDLWFFVHLLSGLTGGTGFLMLGFSWQYTWITALVLTVMWEIFEWKNGIKELLRNRIIDIATGLAGATLGYKYLGSFGYSGEIIFYILIVEALLLTALSKIGWRNYRSYSHQN